MRHKHLEAGATKVRILHCPGMTSNGVRRLASRQPCVPPLLSPAHRVQPKQEEEEEDLDLHTPTNETDYSCRSWQ